MAAEGLPSEGAKEEQPVEASGSPANVYLLSYAFNQDYSCFVCGTTAGFRVFTTSPVSEVHRRESSTPAFQHRSVALVAMLFKTNIFAMVTVSDEEPTNMGSGSGGHRIEIYDDAKRKFIAELRSRNEVKGVVMIRSIIVMVCEYQLYVYTTDKLRVILHLTTISNLQGLCAVAAESDPWILCCPGQSTGAVRVQVGQDDRATHVFTAHQSALAALALNASGSLVATASESGTVVKVFQTSTGQLLYRLRRSVQKAVISSLAFRADDRFLGVASSSSTVHIFKLDPEAAVAEAEPPSVEVSPAMGPAQDPRPSSFSEPSPSLPETGDQSRGSRIASTLKDVVSAVASRAMVETATDVVGRVLPTYFNDLRSFGLFRIPDVDRGGQATVDTRAKQSTIVGPLLAFHRTEPYFYVLHYSGLLYECSFKPDHDVASLGTQECSLVCATTWFAVRPDFKVQGAFTRVPTVAGGEYGEEGEAEDWQML